MAQVFTETFRIEVPSSGAVEVKTTFKVGREVDILSLPSTYEVEEAMVRTDGTRVLVGGAVRKGKKGKIYFPWVVFSIKGEVEASGCGCENNPLLKELSPSLLSEERGECWKSKKSKSTPLGCKHLYPLLHFLHYVANQTPPPPAPAVALPPPEPEEDFQVGGVSVLRLVETGRHLLLWGPPGEGKTTLAEEVCHFLIQKGWERMRIEGGLHVSSLSLIGGRILKGGESPWQAGTLLRAFIKANKGGRVVLIVDELPRIPQKEQGVLIASLYPVKVGGQEVFSLSVPELGRSWEVPVGHLFVVATGNLGENFSGGLVDRALEERFLPVYLEKGEPELREILSSLCRERGFSETIVEKLLSARKGVRELGRNEGIPITLSLRVMADALKLASTEQQVPSLLSQRFIREEERELVNTVIRKVFGA